MQNTYMYFVNINEYIKNVHAHTLYVCIYIHTCILFQQTCDLWRFWTRDYVFILWDLLNTGSHQRWSVENEGEVAAKKAASKQFNEVKNMMGSQQVRTACFLTIGNLVWMERWRTFGGNTEVKKGKISWLR